MDTLTATNLWSIEVDTRNGKGAEKFPHLQTTVGRLLSEHVGTKECSDK